ncbi:hypothetical protein EBU71_19530, partial [bacterium]|nr:hypothetical protein [Candidatus Elulimicrobium humile]
FKIKEGTSSNIKSKNSSKFLRMASGGSAGGKYANYMPSQEEIDKMYASANWQGYGKDGTEGRKVDDKVAGELRKGLEGAISNETIFDESSKIETFSTDFGGGAKFTLTNAYRYDDPRYPSFGKMVIDPLLSQEALSDENSPMNILRQQRRTDLINYLVQGVELGEQNRQAVIDTIRSNLEERDRINELNQQQQDAYKQQQKNALYGALMSFGIGLAGAGLSSALPQFGASSPAQQFAKTNSGLPGGRLSVSGPSANLPTPSVGGRLSVPSVIGTTSYPSLPGPSARLSVPTNTSNYLTPTMPSARLSVPQYINQTPYTSPTAAYQRYVGYQGGYNSPFYQKNTITPYRGAIYRKEGGSIGFAKGGSPKDNIPALLMGGEYVINKDVVDFYGKNFFDDLNKGKIKKFAEGGMVGNANPTSTNNNFNENKQVGDIANEINITVNINGSSVNSTESSKEGSSNNQENTLESQR